MKPIKGFEGLYSVTSCGRVFSHHSNKFLKQTYISKGYPSVRLCLNGIAHTYTVQKLVAATYLDKPGNNSCGRIKHLDGNKSNNCWLNLRYVPYTTEHFAIGRKRKKKPA